MCTSPRAASYNLDGSINFSKKHYNKELVPFKLPCGKCAECLLERAREWSVRCTHEAEMHQQNCFITLTYSNDHIPSNGKLFYPHFQQFMKDLRKHAQLEGIGFFMCGEYGETTGRPHYHACIFGYDFEDKKFLRENDLGDKIWTSESLDRLWGMNDPQQKPNEIGTVTPQSAGYVARYVLKKQNPTAPQGFQKMSRQNAVGKRWIEKWYEDVFIRANGSVIIDGKKTKVPRYYEKWLKEQHPEIWKNYVTQIKPANTERLKEKAEKEYEIYLHERELRGYKNGEYRSPLARKREILKHKQKRLKRSFE